MDAGVSEVEIVFSNCSFSDKETTAFHYTAVPEKSIWKKKKQPGFDPGLLFVRNSADAEVPAANEHQQCIQSGDLLFGSNDGLIGHRLLNGLVHAIDECFGVNSANLDIIDLANHVVVSLQIISCVT